MVELHPKVVFKHVLGLETGSLFLCQGAGVGLTWHVRAPDPSRLGGGWCIVLDATQEETLLKRNESVLSYGYDYRIELPGEPDAWFSADAPPSLSIGAGQRGCVLVAHMRGNDGDATYFNLPDFSEASAEHRLYTKRWTLVMERPDGERIELFRLT